MKGKNTHISEVELKNLLDNIYSMTIQGTVDVPDQYICNILDDISTIIEDVDSMSKQEKCIIENVCLFSIGLFIKSGQCCLVKKYINTFKKAITKEKFKLINRDFNIAKAYILSNLSDISLDNELNKKMLQLEKQYHIADGTLKAKAYIYCYNKDALEMVNLMDTICTHKEVAESRNNEERCKWLNMIFDELITVYNKTFNTQYNVMIDKLQMSNSEIVIQEGRCKNE